MSRRPGILHLVNILGIGGAEGQFVERLRWLDPRRHRSVVATLRCQGPNLNTLTAIGLRPHEIPLGPSLAHPATLRAVRDIAELVEKENIALIHAQDFYTNLVAAPAAMLSGRKLVVSRLDLAHWHGPRRRAALRWVCHVADRIWVNAWAIERKLVEEEHIAPEKIRVIENGIDLQRFDRRRKETLERELPVPPGARVAVIVANFHPVKGQEDAIDALGYLGSRATDLHLLLVGEGERREALEARVRARRLQNRVHFLGHRLDVPAILDRADILISSSRAEGLSNSIIEGMAAGLGIVATAVGGTPELIRDGESGYLVPPHAPQAMAVRLGALLDDPERLRAFGRAAREMVESRLAIELMARRFERLYDEVLEEDRRPWRRPVRSLRLWLERSNLDVGPKLREVRS